MFREDSVDSEDKAALRSRVRARLRSLSGADRERDSADLRRILLESPEWAAAQRIGFFHPRFDEPDLLPLIDVCWAQGKEAALPAWEPYSESYAFRQIRNWEELRTGQFGIPEPSASCRVVALESLDLVFVPGIGFTTDGRRLGRGRGFYDRLLRPFHGVTCGVCFGFQLLERIPVEPHDVRMKRVLVPNPPKSGAEQVEVE